jgi:AbiJ N-terminal domain 3
VRELNAVFRRDGYELRAEREESGYPLYRLVSLARGPTGAPKNLIFASNGPKPEIGFSDAINNDIVILTKPKAALSMIGRYGARDFFGTSLWTGGVTSAEASRAPTMHVS